MRQNLVWRLLVLALLLAPCAPRAVLAGPDGKTQAAPKLFHGVGVVTGVDAKSGLIDLNHEAIPGLMDAMEMEYQARPASLVEGLAKGDRVDFTVNGGTLEIVDLVRRPATK